MDAGGSDGMDSSSDGSDSDGEGRLDTAVILELLVYLRAVLARGQKSVSSVGTQTDPVAPPVAPPVVPPFLAAQTALDVRRAQNVERTKCKLKVEKAVLEERVRALQNELSSLKNKS